MIDVYVEVGTKKTFACALEWPGWARSGKDEAAALEALAAYAERYAPVVRRAGLRFPTRQAASLQVVEHVKGSGSTDFGVPGTQAKADETPITPARAGRLAKIVTASWDVLDEVVAHAPATLAKGPRGGGRDRDEIARHVADAEVDYARKLGLDRMQPGPDLRSAILDRIRHPTSYERAEKGWYLPYGARRVAWHILDHAWEIEDKS